MDLRGVLPEPRGHHVFRVSQRHAIHVVNMLSDTVVLPAMRFARRCEIIGTKVKAIGNFQVRGSDMILERRNLISRGICLDVAFANHDPSHIVDNNLIVLVAPGCFHPDDTGLAA